MQINSLPQTSATTVRGAQKSTISGLGPEESKEWSQYLSDVADLGNVSTPPEGSLTRRPAGLGGTDIMGRLKANFDTWDADHNGTVTAQEIEAAVANPKVKGRDAAALAALKNVLEASTREKGRKKSTGLSSTQLAKLEKQYYADDKTALKFDAYYAYALRKLDDTPAAVFATDMPNPHHIIQGGAGSCAYLTPLTSLVRRDGHTLPDMIKNLPNGGYEVDFPGLGPVDIKAPTDTEVALYATAGKDGRWLSIMEKAWGASRDAKHPYVGVRTRPEDSIGALTGHASTVAKLPTRISGTPSRHWTIKRIEESLAAGHIVTAWTTDKTPTKGIVGYHAYSVVGVDRTGVKLHNPWGEGEAQDADGNARDGKDDGEFKLTAKEFFQNYRYLVCETDEPYVKPDPKQAKK